MSDLPKASQITQALTDLLRTIKQANGYYTDLGLRVYSGRAALYQDSSPRPYASLVSRMDTPNNESRHRSRNNRSYDLIITINTGMDYDLEQDKLLYDIRRAISTQTKANILGGLVQSIDQSEAILDNPFLGSTTAQIVLTLTVVYGETYPT